jgi:hypothetical protein
LDQARAAVQAGLALDPTFTIRRFRDSPVHLSTIRPSSRGANALLWACAGPGCQRGESFVRRTLRG